MKVYQKFKIRRQRVESSAFVSIKFFYFLWELVFMMMFPLPMAGPYLDFIASFKFLPIHCFTFQNAFLVSTLKTHGANVKVANQVF